MAEYEQGLCLTFHIIVLFVFFLLEDFAFSLNLHGSSSYRNWKIVRTDIKYKYIKTKLKLGSNLWISFCSIVWTLYFPLLDTYLIELRIEYYFIIRRHILVKKLLKLVTHWNKETDLRLNVKNTLKYAYVHFSSVYFCSTKFLSYDTTLEQSWSFLGQLQIDKNDFFSVQ